MVLRACRSFVGALSSALFMKMGVLPIVTRARSPEIIRERAK